MSEVRVGQQWQANFPVSYPLRILLERVIPRDNIIARIIHNGKESSTGTWYKKEDRLGMSVEYLYKNYTMISETPTPVPSVRVGQVWNARWPNAVTLRVEKVSDFIYAEILSRGCGIRPGLVVQFPLNEFSLLPGSYTLVSEPLVPETDSNTEKGKLRIEIMELRDALQWALPRINWDNLRCEGMGRYPDKFTDVTTLAYGEKPCVR